MTSTKGTAHSIGKALVLLRIVTFASIPGHAADSKGSIALIGVTPSNENIHEAVITQKLSRHRQCLTLIHT